MPLFCASYTSRCFLAAEGAAMTDMAGISRITRRVARASALASMASIAALRTLALDDSAMCSSM